MVLKRIHFLLSLLILTLAACELPLRLSSDDGVILRDTPVPVTDLPTPIAQGDLTATYTPIPADVADTTPTAGSTPGVSTSPTPPLPAFTPTPLIPPYIVQPGSPIAIPNFSHPELQCDWMGVAGQIFGVENQPQRLIVLRIEGTLAGTEIRQITLSGVAPIYGPGGYEVTLASRTLGSTGSLWIRLYDLDGKPLSNQIYFDTYNDCNRNLILINFVKIPVLNHKAYLPSLQNSIAPPAATPAPAP